MPFADLAELSRRGAFRTGHCPPSEKVPRTPDVTAPRAMPTMSRAGRDIEGHDVVISSVHFTPAIRTS